MRVGKGGDGVMDMTHPEIVKTERFGSRYANTWNSSPIIGNCVVCGHLITTEHEYYEDFDNIYCSRECADKYHGLKCMNE